MNIHTRLVGVIDAVVLSMAAAMTLVMLSSLLSPHTPVDDEGSTQHYSVTIEQIS